MSRDSNLNTFIQEEIETSDFDNACRVFLSLLLVDNNQLERCHFLHRFVGFFRGQDKYLPAAFDFAWGEVTAAQELAGLERVTLKLCRAVELLRGGCSLKPIEDLPELWKWSEELGCYYHVKNPSYKKNTPKGPVMTVTEVHYFPDEFYHHWQGYSKPESLVGQEYFLDPYKAPMRYYYTRAWSGKGDLKAYLAKGPRELPEGTSLDGWLKAQRERKGIEERDYDTIFARRVA